MTLLMKNRRAQSARLSTYFNFTFWRTLFLLLITITSIGGRCGYDWKIHFKEDSILSEKKSIKLLDGKIIMDVTGYGNLWHTGAQQLYRLSIDVHVDFSKLREHLTVEPGNIIVLFNDLPMPNNQQIQPILESTNTQVSITNYYYCNLYRLKPYLDSLGQPKQTSIAIDLSKCVKYKNDYVWIDTIYAIDHKLGH
jgi:hypothetical protein